VGHLLRGRVSAAGGRRAGVSVQREGGARTPGPEASGAPLLSPPYLRLRMSRIRCSDRLNFKASLRMLRPLLYAFRIALFLSFVFLFGM